MIRQITESCCIQIAIESFIAKNYQWRNRVLKGTSERLERNEPKGSRCVLRGLDGSNPIWLPSENDSNVILLPDKSNDVTWIRFLNGLLSVIFEDDSNRLLTSQIMFKTI